MKDNTENKNYKPENDKISLMYGCIEKSFTANSNNYSTNDDDIDYDHEPPESIPDNICDTDIDDYDPENDIMCDYYECVEIGYYNANGEFVWDDESEN